MKTLLLVQQDLLSNSDVIKLFIPFLFSIILIWLKILYDRFIERRYKNEHIWRGIKQQFDDCIKGTNALNKTWMKLYKDGLIIYFSIDFPQSLIEYSKRLTELEWKNSYIYSEYISNIEIVKCGHKNLQILLNQATFHNLKEQEGVKIKSAIESQICALKIDFITLAVSELELVKYIQKKYRKDKQEISKMQLLLDEAKNLSQMAPSQQTFPNLISCKNVAV